MKNNIKTVLITGSKRVGKDTFFNLLNNLYPNKFIAFRFADELKNDLDFISLKMFNKRARDLDGEEKEVFRPILISYGCSWRELDPIHWVRVVDKQIDENENSNLTPIILDCRFSNEILFFKEKYKNQTVTLEIIREGGPEPTDEEKRNIPLLNSTSSYSYMK
jgi:hypothetical protein